MDENLNRSNHGPPVRPYWIPEGVDFSALPADLRTAISTLVSPAYEELVLRAKPGLEQTTGTTIVQFMWLEVLEMFEIGREFMQVDSSPESRQERDAKVSRLLKVVAAKSKASAFWVRIQDFRERHGALPGGYDPIQRSSNEMV
ncbi:MAG: hypothetical protein ACYTGL_00015 [Planctomycetota bacterium]|jgi:hypothetical protein